MPSKSSVMSVHVLFDSFFSPLSLSFDYIFSLNALYVCGNIACVYKFKGDILITKTDIQYIKNHLAMVGRKRAITHKMLILMAFNV